MKTIKVLACALVVTSGMVLTSCGDDDSNGGNNNLPPIGGYNSADEIGSADLLAYWPLNGNGTESKSGAQPSSSVAASYVQGVKGQALSLNEGYLAYNPITNLSTGVGNMSVSMWVKVSNNKTETGNNPTMFFTMTRPMNDTQNEWIGNFNVLAETGHFAASVDTLKVKGIFASKKADGSANVQDVLNDPVQGGDQANKVAGQWAHVVVTWDATNSLFKVYCNGKKISNPAWELRNDSGLLNFFTPTSPVIGTFGSVLTGNAEPWQKSMVGQIDEIRVWKKALGTADINALYELEKAGR